jgi:glycogen debranching enzyme
MSRRAGRFLRRTLSAMRIVARDGRIPRPLRLLTAVGIAPIPGPVDEIVLLLVAPVVWLRYRALLEEAWRTTGEAA